ncbi:MULTISPECIES: sugar ABC transporter permease [Streptomyces]|uniref:ABC transporter permease n=1 Tax=Streptomyces venezuelae TaxID=54571 RepID=A0A5P2BE20_STRVZ|nr:MULTISPECIES: sugar ABC transporter permease [Streptomyces]NEA00744.1 sugar ABC transporter permease [Streptomyces sp. SID10116]MYY85720.1 ABC transporter permease subunit [Streptomyces sp. SID335]MYZ17325.1 ABC transporter permease subunit [Streptomyces sp. SID337]NDZ86302.1 sugar ABC transporter permease [Streptomyces sp. SID10115]NEB44301.1 sugar ABC transporter permease [Streptomyces sp. SID339]
MSDTAEYAETASPGKGDAAPAATGSKTSRTPSPWRSRLYRWDIKASPYVFVAPFFLFFGAFGLFPLLYTGWASLHRLELTNLDDSTWLGLDNYTNLLQSDYFWNALGNTFTIGVISTVPQLAIALGIAHLLNYKLRGSTLWRVAMLAPYATSVASASLVFTLLFAWDGGMVNWLIGSVGIDPVNWRESSWGSQFAVSSIVIWRWTGYNALIYLAAMQAVPHDLYESAALDGASRWQQFRHVTIPMLRPTILFTVVVSTIGATQLFGEPLLFGGTAGSKGGADHQFQTLGLYLYDQGWINGHLGRASAVAWLMLVILLLIAAVNMLIARRLRKDR